MAVPRGAEKQEKYDFILTDVESATPGTFLGLMIAKDPETKKKFPVVERRIPPFGQRVSQGQFGIGDRDPLTHLVWAQDDWSDGALIASTNRSNRGYKYGSMDARFPSVIGQGIARNYGSSRGNQDAPIGLLLIDPHFEAPAAKTGWTNDAGGNGTLTFADTTDPRTAILGNKALKAVITAVTNVCSQALANPTVYASREITVSCYFKRSAGTGGIRINIVETGAGAGTTNGNTVTASSYTVSTATRTLNAGVTGITVQVEVLTASGTFFADDASVYSGTVLTPARNGPVVLSDGVYMAFGRFICKLRTSAADTFVWDAVYVHASATATDIVAYENSAAALNVFVAFGAAVAYVYGSDTTWTASTLAGTANENKAIYWAVSRNQLWKSETANTVKMATNPVNGGSFGTAYTIGRADAEITGLHRVSDTIFVGKEDGLWKYRRTYVDGASADLFEDQTDEFETNLSLDHFRKSAQYGDWLYYTMGGAGFYRTSLVQAQDISPLFSKPAADAKGIVRAVARDQHQLWAFVDDRLFSVHDLGDRLVPHTPAPGPMPTPSSTAVFTIPVTQVTAWATPGTLASQDLGGTPARVDWTSPSNAAASDDAYATNAPGPHYFGDGLRATNFGFSIPSGAAIVGIEVEIERKASTAASVSDYELYLIKAGARAGGNMAAGTTLWPAADAAATYGGAATTWGAALVEADVELSTFGVELSVTNGAASSETASVDRIRMRVHYQQVPTQADAIFIRAANVVQWNVSSVMHPHLLGISYGLDTTDNVPYAITDCWALPKNAATPNLDQTSLPHSPATDVFVTSDWDGGAPTEKKAGTMLHVLLEDAAADQPLTVKYHLDGEAPGARTLGTLSGSQPMQTLAFEDLSSGLPDAAIFYAIGLQFECSFTGSVNKRRIKAFELEMAPVTEVLEDWEVAIQVGGASYNDGSQQDNDLDLSKANIIDRLRTLEERGFQFKLVEDWDGNGEVTVHSVQIRQGTLVRTIPLERSPNDGEVWRFRMHKVHEEH